eukprot:tig00022075_g23583.t1
MTRERRAKRARTAASAGEGDIAAASGAQATSSSGGSASSSGAPALRIDVAATTIAAGGCPLDVLPDELLGRMLLKAAQRDWISWPTCGRLSLLDPEDDEPDVQPNELVKLKAVCRRFRRIVDDGSLWGRVALWEPDDTAIEVLTKLPEKARAAVQRITMDGGSVSPAGYRLLLSAFRGQLEELDVLHAGEQEMMDFAGLAAIRCASRLRKLYVGADASSWNPAHFASPNVIQPLSIIQFLSKLEALELDMPLPVSVLEGLVPLSVQLWPTASETDLRPLCALTKLKALAPLCFLDWLGFLESMPCLEHVTINLRRTINAALNAVFVSQLQSLRTLSLFLTKPNEHTDGVLRIMSAIAGLSTLKIASISIFPEAFDAFSSMPLAWSNLHKLMLRTSTVPPNSVIPGAFLKRLAACAPSLSVLRTKVPLPISTDLAAVALLNFLHKLEMEGLAVERLSPIERESLQSVLLDTRIIFEDNHEETSDSE